MEGNTFLDVVGYQVDSSFEKPLTVQVSSSTGILSVGG